MIPVRNIIAIALIFIFSSCADQPMDNIVPSTVPIAPHLTLIMPKPGDLGRSVEATQLVTAHYGQQRFAFEGHIHATSEHFLFVGLDLMGRKIITIDWTADKITYEKASWVPSRLRPENILADMVLLYWPEAVVQRDLVASGGKLVAKGNSRTIIHDDKEIWRADYRSATNNDPWSGRLHYRNLARGYEFYVQSAEIVP